MQTLLITGGAGFIGSNFISYLLKSEKNIKVSKFRFTNLCW